MKNRNLSSLPRLLLLLLLAILFSLDKNTGVPILFPVGATVARGGTFTINGSFLSDVSEVVAYDANWGGPYTLTIVSKTDKSIVLQIPSDLAPGEYIDISVTASGSIYDFYVDPGQGFMVN